MVMKSLHELTDHSRQGSVIISVLLREDRYEVFSSLEYVNVFRKVVVPLLLVDFRGCDVKARAKTGSYHCVAQFETCSEESCIKLLEQYRASEILSIVVVVRCEGNKSS